MASLSPAAIASNAFLAIFGSRAPVPLRSRERSDSVTFGPRDISFLALGEHREQESLHRLFMVAVRDPDVRALPADAGRKPYSSYTACTSH